MKQAVLLIAFGEPPTPEREHVLEYLENIFYQNAALEAADSEADRRARAAELAKRRASGLMAEYERIRGSPLNRQACEQTATLQNQLEQRGFDVEVTLGYQFMEPSIETRLSECVADDVDQLVSLPTYPLCGPSTTIAALDRVEAAARDDHLALTHVSGWHRHPTYLRVRADAIADFTADEGIDLAASGTSLVFSAHGTPMQYIEAGSRYVDYVAEYCETVAEIVGVDAYELGYQNHDARDLEWTQPPIEEVIASIDGDRVVVDPASFLYEQSETLADLDIDLAGVADAHNLPFHRVPVPHDDGRITGVYADLVEPLLGGSNATAVDLRSCRCRSGNRTRCLNAR